MVSDVVLLNSIAAPAVVVDGTLLVGTGIGTRTGDPHDLEDSISREPRTLVALCVPGTTGCGQCQNGIDDDDDGRLDFPDDPGCVSADDASEKQSVYACDNGLDDDGDGAIDADDPGCGMPEASFEDPQCDDGVDQNGDGLVDFLDGNCQSFWPYWESPPACGLGVELVLVVPGLAWWRRRTRGR
jgi:hypothetical protein